MGDEADELRRLERALASRDPAGLSAGLGALIADDFVEFGARGRVWSAAEIRAILETEPPEPVVIEAFAVHELAPDVVLATYRIAAPGRSNRSSIWVRRAGRWQVRFHQGTPAAS